MNPLISTSETRGNILAFVFVSLIDSFGVKCF